MHESFFRGYGLVPIPNGSSSSVHAVDTVGSGCAIVSVATGNR
jgi:hypothetical protein